jgi:hypothetical protein
MTNGTYMYTWFSVAQWFHRKRLKFERQKLAHISFSKQGEINQLLDMIYFHCCIV